VASDQRGEESLHFELLGRRRGEIQSLGEYKEIIYEALSWGSAPIYSFGGYDRHVLVA